MSTIIVRAKINSFPSQHKPEECKRLFVRPNCLRQCEGQIEASVDTCYRLLQTQCWFAQSLRLMLEYEKVSPELSRPSHQLQTHFPKWTFKSCPHNVWTSSSVSFIDFFKILSPGARVSPRPTFGHRHLSLKSESETCSLPSNLTFNTNSINPQQNLHWSILINQGTWRWQWRQ